MMMTTSLSRFVYQALEIDLQRSFRELSLEFLWNANHKSNKRVGVAIETSFQRRVEIFH